MDFKRQPDTSFRPPGELSGDQAREQADALREAIRHHDYLYYVKSAPEISDATYDALFRRLQELEESFPDLRSEDSPTQRVGAEPVDALEKVEHAAPMLSLEAVLEADEAQAFVGRVTERADGTPRLDLEPKFDGFSVELVYLDGQLKTGSTRGNGEQGEDITRNLRTVRALPLKLRAEGDPPRRLAVRGEVFLPRNGFTAVNSHRVERGEEPFANPRNAAAGMMRQLDSRNLAGMPFDLFFYRAGDVIPEVQERVKEPGRARGDPFQMPGQCPVCGTELAREGVYVVCPAGLACEAQLVGHLTHYADRDAMDIEHLGEKTARQLVEDGLVRDLADLYALGRQDIERLEGFAERSARQLHDAIQGSLEPRLDRFLFALGIRHVGRRASRLIAQRFEHLEALMEAEADTVETIPGIGPEIAASVAGFFADQRNREVIERLRGQGLKIRPMPRVKKDLRGRTFVFTGSLEHHTRDQAKELVDTRGGRATSGVSGETDYLVVGASPGSKLSQAREQGVEILDEDAFEKLLREE